MKKLTLIAEIKNCFSLFVLFSMDRTLQLLCSCDGARGQEGKRLCRGQGFVAFLSHCFVCLIDFVERGNRRHIW